MLLRLSLPLLLLPQLSWGIKTVSFKKFSSAFPQTTHSFKDHCILACDGTHVVYSTNSEIIEDFNVRGSDPPLRLSYNLFKIILWMFAERANEIVRKFLTNIFITADDAAVFLAGIYCGANE